MLSELHEKSTCRVAKKMKMYTKLKQEEKEEKLEKIRKKAQRGNLIKCKILPCYKSTF